MTKYIFIKELQALRYTWKSWIWFILTSIILSVTSYLFLTNKELSLLDQTEMLWIMSKVIIGIALLIITVDASTIINNEFENETLGILFMTQLKMKDFILGKLLASFTLWIGIYLISIPYMIVVSSGTNLTVPFLIAVLFLGSIAVLGFQMLTFGISFLYRSSKNTLTSSLIILLLFVIPAVASSTVKNNILVKSFSVINPVDNIFASLDFILVDYQTSLFSNLQYIVPVLIFCIITFIFMIYSIKIFKKEGVFKSY